MGFKPIQKTKLSNLDSEEFIDIKQYGSTEKNRQCPLRFWNNPNVLKIVKLSVKKDIRPSYLKLIRVANETIFKGKLLQHPDLFPKPSKGRVRN